MPLDVYMWNCSWLPRAFSDKTLSVLSILWCMLDTAFAGTHEALDGAQGRMKQKIIGHQGIIIKLKCECSLWLKKAKPEKLGWKTYFSGLWSSESTQLGQWRHCLHQQFDYKDLGWLMKTQLFTASSGSSEQAYVSTSLETTDAITVGRECMHWYEHAHIHKDSLLGRNGTSGCRRE